MADRLRRDPRAEQKSSRFRASADFTIDMRGERLPGTVLVARLPLQTGNDEGQASALYATQWLPPNIEGVARGYPGGRTAIGDQIGKINRL